MAKLDVTRIAPKLWMGAAPPTGKALRDFGFDVVVLCAREYQPSERSFPGVRVIRAPFDDDKLTPAAEATAAEAARHVAAAVTKGQRVLVTCAAGRNRSGLVVARTLQKLTPKAPPQLIVDHVQRLRPLALTNTHFVQNLYGRVSRA